MGVLVPIRFANPSCRSSQKGFGSTSQEQGAPPPGGETKAESSSLDDLEARIRNKRPSKGKIEPQVKVQSSVVDAVTGKTPATAAGQAESAVVLGLFYYFLLILIEGLMLAGSGFLPEETDQWIQDTIYPSYSFTTLGFLACSSLYGLFKVGKLPGQKQM